MDVISVLSFLYFATLHADQLGFVVAGHTIRFNNILALILVLLLALRCKKDLFHIDSRLAFSLLLITCSLVLSLIFSPYKERALLFVGWYGLTLLCYVLLPYFLIKMLDARKLLTLYCASFVIVGLYAFLQVIFSCFHIADPFANQRIAEGIVRPNAFAYEPSFYALYMTPFIVLCNLHYILCPNTAFFYPKRLNFFKTCSINILYLISFSTSAFFTYLIFLPLVLLLPQFKKFRKRIVYFALGFSVLFLACMALLPSLMQTFFMKFFFFGFMGHHSFYFRWSGIVNAWTLFCEHPFFGVGLGAIPAYLYDAYLVGNEKYIFFEQHLKEMTLHPFKYFEPTNVFSEVLASLGLFGMLAFGNFFWAFFSKAKKWASEPHVSHFLVSSVVMLVVLQFNQGVLRTYIWTHLAICFALFEKRLDSFSSLYNNCVQKNIEKPFLQSARGFLWS